MLLIMEYLSLGDLQTYLIKSAPSVSSVCRLPTGGYSRGYRESTVRTDHGCVLGGGVEHARPNQDGCGCRCRSVKQCPVLTDNHFLLLSPSMDKQLTDILLVQSGL